MVKADEAFYRLEGLLSNYFYHQIGFDSFFVLVNIEVVLQAVRFINSLIIKMIISEYLILHN